MIPCRIHVMIHRCTTTRVFLLHSQKSVVHSICCTLFFRELIKSYTKTTRTTRSLKTNVSSVGVLKNKCYDFGGRLRVETSGFECDSPCAWFRLVFEVCYVRDHVHVMFSQAVRRHDTVRFLEDTIRFSLNAEQGAQANRPPPKR